MRAERLQPEGSSIASKRVKVLSWRDPGLTYLTWLHQSTNYEARL